MKRLMAILFAIAAAGALMQAALAYGISSSAGIVGTNGSGFFASVSGAKNGEDKLAEALGQLQAWKAAKEQEKKQSSGSLAFSGSALSNSTADNASLFNEAAENSTLTNSTNSTNSTNGSSADSFPLSTSISQAAAGNDVGRKADEANASILAGQQNIGSGSKNRFSGYYGITASRHEIGKSGINSHMFLRGNFEMDKSVKFQDQGMD